MKARRDPRTCPHRKRLDSSQLEGTGGVEYCGLAHRLVESVVEPQSCGCLVDDGVCAACCRYRLDDLPQINPVVASLVYSATARSEPHIQTNAVKRVRRAQLGEFSCRQLQNAEDRVIDEEALGVRKSASLFLRRRLRTWMPAAAARIGLAGWNSRFGLGHVNADICRWLPVSTWLAPISKEIIPASEMSACHAVLEYAPYEASTRQVQTWLSKIDVAVFVERPPFENFAQIAQQNGIKLVCVPMWEWIRPGLSWVAAVDLMLCPTRFTFELLTQWKHQFGFKWKVQYVPWPIDVDRFQFRPRQVCRRFVSVIGNGGRAAYDVDGYRPPIHRKGLEVLLAAASKLPQCEFILYTTKHIRRTPSNVEVRGFAGRNDRLYEEGDVCIQASYWEGCGLPLLECQAAGMPLITTDRPPMNEYNPLAVIPAVDEYVATLGGAQYIPVPHIAADDLITVLKNMHGNSIADTSQQARHFIEQNHSWRRSAASICQAIEGLTRTPRYESHA